MRLISLSLAVAILCSPALAIELSQPLQPFIAEYSATYKGKRLRGTRQLSVENGQWQLLSEFKMTFVRFRESSRGQIDNQNKLSVDRYDKHRKIFGIKKNQSRVFDYDSATVTFNDGKKQGRYSIPANTFDTASQQLYIREMLMRGETDFSMAMAARTDLKHLDFSANQAAAITLPFGTVEAIRVDRVVASPDDRKVSMWFSPKLNYQLVKLSQTERDGNHYEINLTKLD